MAPLGFKKLQEKVTQICEKTGRDPNEVTILGASKGQSPETINRVIREGLIVIGENYYQEFRDKKDSLVPGVSFHYIGHLQSSKISGIVKLFDCIETASKLKHLRKIDNAAKNQKKKIDLLIEINIGHEPSKSGVSPSELFSLLEQIDSNKAEFSNCDFCGFMTMGTLGLTQKDKLDEFNSFRELCEQYFSQYQLFTNRVMSFGMSNDFELAIEAGSTEIRIGSLLFGFRP
ncbi:MAG: YggS family pyridoxal phosphate-dependent enzyme [Candidatus Hermodarchaeota archaeon]